MNNYPNLFETKSHSDAYFPYNTYLCTIPLDFTRVYPHWHNDIELIVIKQGEGYVDVDTQTFHVQQGDIVLVRPGQIHSIYQYQQTVMEYENIIFQTTLLYTSNSDPCTIEYFRPYMTHDYTLLCHIHHQTINYNKLSSYINEIDNLCNSQPRYYQLSVKSYLYQFFYLLFSSQEELTPTLPRKSLRKIKQVITYVEEHYNEEITIETTAKHLGVSNSHFMKLFKQNMHMTFTTYLNHYRLNKACTLLTTTDKSILEISEQVGFNNLSYFNRQFKDQYQMTPRNYRNQK